jgi:hypothetical protein
VQQTDVVLASWLVVEGFVQWIAGLKLFVSETLVDLFSELLLCIR